MKTETKNGIRRRIGRMLDAALCGAISIGTGACAMPAGDVGAGAEGSGVEISEGPQSRVASNTLALIEYPDGRSVEFFAPEPGFVLIRERGPVGSVPLTNLPEAEGLSTVELYEYLSGRQAPAALVAASAPKVVDPADVARRAQRERGAPETEVPRQAPQSMLNGVGVTTAALSNGLTPAQFQSALCPASFPRPYYNWLNVTGRGYVMHSDVHGFRSAAQSLRGTIHFTAKYRTWYTWSNMADTDIDAGWYEKVERKYVPTDYDFDAKATVDDADGDAYNMCTHF